MRWMLYGATGFTGRLIAEEAIRQGHTPMLAGRSLEKIQPLAKRLGLEYAVFQLDDVSTIAEAIADMELVYHAAGPFIHTSDPMIRACLATNTHYVDITGEIPVFQNTYRYDDAARSNRIALVSGVGFDVIPSNTLAQYVARQITGATHLEIGLDLGMSMTAGTAKSFLSMMNKPYLARQNGDLVTRPFGADTLEMPLLETDALAVAVPWGDLVTSYHSTGIPNIKTYMTLSPVVIRAMRLLSPLLKATLGSKLLSGFASRLAEMTQRGPSRQDRETLATLIWARARNANGQSAEAWLDTMEVYQFTAAAAIPVVEQILEQSPIGALTPAQALGVDFPLRLPDTHRYDSLEELENAEVG
jgi:short subunit dehydrogenase-like uncharacterized protein